MPKHNVVGYAHDVLAAIGHVCANLLPGGPVLLRKTNNVGRIQELAEFRTRNTTTEFLACEVHKRLARRIKEGALSSQATTSLRVVLRENLVAWAAYDAPLG